MAKRPSPRRVYRGPALGIDPLDMLGWSRVRYADVSTLRGHQHPGQYEICLITSGTVNWWVGNHMHAVRAGQLFITKPDEWHGGEEQTLEPCTLHWLVIQLDAAAPLPGLGKAQMQRLITGFENLTLRCFDASQNTRRHFESLTSEFEQPDEHSPAHAKATLHALLIQTLRDHQAALSRGTRAQPSKPIRTAINHWATHIDDNSTMEDLAHRVGLGVSRFHELFQQEMGFSPAAYRMRLRVHVARDILKQTERNVTDIAAVLGFSSSQHFATAFKQLVGVSPTEYRKRHHR